MPCGPEDVLALPVWRHNYTTTVPECGQTDITKLQVIDECPSAGTRFGTAAGCKTEGEAERAG